MPRPGAIGVGDDARDSVPGARELDRLLDAPSDREGRAAQGAREALRRTRACLHRPRWHAASPWSRIAGASRRAGLERWRAFRPSMPSAASMASPDAGQAAPTGAILTDVLGFKEIGREGRLVRYQGRPDRGRRPVGDDPGDRRFPAGSLGGGQCITSPSGPRTTRQQAEMAEKLADAHGLRTDRTTRPQLLPLDLFPRAGRHPVRDRDRRAGIRGRRAGRGARARAEAAGGPRAAPRARSRRSLPTIDGGREGRRDGRALLRPSLRGSACGRRAAAAAAARHRRQRRRLDAARPVVAARRAAAFSARQGAGARDAAVLPPSRRRRIRRGGSAPARTSSRTLSRRRARPMASARRSRVGYSNGANIAAARDAAAAGDARRRRLAARDGRRCRTPCQDGLPARRH